MSYIYVGLMLIVMAAYLIVFAGRLIVWCLLYVINLVKSNFTD